VHVLGRGGEGTVFKVTDNTGQIRAMKELRKAYNDEESAEEAKLMKLCDHKNVIKLIETFRENSLLYIVTEFCERKSYWLTVQVAISSGAYSNCTAMKENFHRTS
jgi:serine/threonine protein kinase